MALFMSKVTEKLHRIWLLSKLLFKDLLRRRLSLLMLFILPALFDIIILVTTNKNEVPVILGILSDDSVRMLSRQALSFVFLGGAVVAFITSFLAFYLVHQRTEVDRRLVLCGYRPFDIIAAKMAVLIVIVLSIAVYESLIIRPFIEPIHFGYVLAGLFLCGLVYSCYGLLVGAVSTHELEGIFLIVLVANIDVGWLQNPSYYKESSNRLIIEYLPGFFPTQLAMVGTFTDGLPVVAIWGSLLYSAIFLAAAVFAFWLRIRGRTMGIIRR